MVTESVSATLARATVIPAHPVALTDDLRLDARRQRALSRYYIESGADGFAVGVHTSQFAIRPAGMLPDVLGLAAEIADREAPRQFLRIAGVAGDVRQAVEEAELAARSGYNAVLLTSVGLAHLSESQLLDRAKAVGEVLPVIGFLMQSAVGGRRFSKDYWRMLADQPSTVGIKLAPFNRYATLEAISAVKSSDRGSEVVLLTGNDDNIVADLLTPFPDEEGRNHSISGGLLGQWAVGTKAAVDLGKRVIEARAAGMIPSELLADGARLTALNASLFDVVHDFKGCVAGVQEALRQLGLLGNSLCLDPDDALSPGQAQLIARSIAVSPDLVDVAFIAANRDRWLQ